MIAAQIAARLGGACRSGAWWRCRCPVHGSRGPTLALRDGERGLVAYCHAGCCREDILAELCRRGLLPGTTYRRAERIVTRVQSRDDPASRIAAARRIWDAARDVRGSPVAHYLASRGISVPPPPSLRYAPALRRQDGIEARAMVARVNGRDGELIGVHRTWLYRDAGGIWRRHDRASIGPIGGGAVRFAPTAKRLVVGEGIETCLAVLQVTNAPVWAALSTSGLMSLVLPAIVQKIIILADHDANGAGERAARVAAQRLLAEGRRVRIAMPPEPGTDFADLLLGPCTRITEARDVAA